LTWDVTVTCPLPSLIDALQHPTTQGQRQILRPSVQENRAIAKMTARCAQYVSALKTVGLCKRKISRRLRKNLHITNLSLFGGAVKLFSKYSIQCDHGTYDLNVTDGQTDGQCGTTAR